MNEKVFGHTESNEKTEIYDFSLLFVFANVLRATFLKTAAQSNDNNEKTGIAVFGLFVVFANDYSLH